MDAIHTINVDVIRISERKEIEINKTLKNGSIRGNNRKKRNKVKLINFCFFNK
jgi:hypothetical protein